MTLVSVSAALGRPCQPGPNPGGLRRIRSGPVSGGGLTRRGRPGARRASPRAGPLRSGEQGLGRNREAWLARAQCGGSFGLVGRVAREISPGFQQRSAGGRGRRGLSAGVPGLGGNSRVPPAWSPASTRRPQQVSNLRRGNSGQPRSTAGKGVPR